MKLLKLLCFLIFPFFALSCGTTQSKTIDECSSSVERSPSSLQCKQLFKKNDSANVIKNQIDDATKQIASKLKLASVLLPPSATDAFWDTVVQLAENNDSKIQLETSKMVLTKNYNNTLKIHSTYKYDTPSNSFILSKIEYTLPHQQKQTLSEAPIDPQTNKLKLDLFVNFESVQASYETISIIETVHYDVYKNISDEIKKLSLFTSYEIHELYKLPDAQRSLKYNTLSRSRSLKKFFISNIVSDYLLMPIKTLTVSLASVFIYSHADFIKNVTETTPNKTPSWVAPSVVKMAAFYPKEVQPELVKLMKLIENQESINTQKAQELNKSKGQLKIDEADQFSIEYDSRTKKTYFFVTHEAENGQTEIYATEIISAQYPNLTKYFNLKIK